MPAKSKRQQRAAGMAYAAKKGELSPKKLKGAAKEMYNGMSKKSLRHYAKTKHSKMESLINKIDAIFMESNSY